MSTETRNNGEGIWVKEPPQPQAPGIYYRCVCGAITPGVPRWCPVCEQPLEADIRGELRYAQKTDPMYYAARITELERLVQALIADRSPFGLRCAECGIDCTHHSYSQYAPDGMSRSYCRECYRKRWG